MDDRRQLFLPVEQFCYPWGDRNDRVVDAVRDAGLAGATTTVRCRARAPLDPVSIPRIHVMQRYWLPQVCLNVHTRFGDRS